VYRFLLIVLMTAPIFGEIPNAILAEHDLQKRSDLALQEADEQITEASKAYSPNGGELKDFEKHLAVVGELAELSLKSLQDSGKRARKQPKYFKRAELKLRSLLRRLDTLEKNVLVDDRPPVAKAKGLLAGVHDQILQDIMSKR
jgi:hypothetical protein